MKPSFLQMNGSKCIVLVLGLTAISPAAESSTTLEIPAALQSSVAEVPADQNHLVKFLETFGKSSPELTRKVRDATERLEAGNGVEDKALLRKLRGQHELAGEMLTPPLAFSPDRTPVAIGIFHVFLGAEVLARQAMWEKDYARADRILGDMLRWSRQLRNAQPNQLQWIIARSGWKLAFDALLQDLPHHKNPSARQIEIEGMFRENRIEKTELVECLKMEIRWWKVYGGLKAMLDRPEASSMTMFLKPPFNDVSIRDLRKLPYDLEADFRREMTETLGMLDGLKRGVPISRWPGFEVPATGRGLEDYRKRPNGLGDLFHEQDSSGTQRGFWASALSCDRLLETCLLWLKTERGGGRFSDERFNEALDPVDGKPLSIDINLRTIRSRGPDMKMDPPDPGSSPMPSAGFCVSGDDVVIVVPRWNADSEAKDGGP